MTNTYPNVGGRKRTWLVTLAVMVLGLLTTGYCYNRSETARIRQEKYDGIRAIGEAKANEIARWRLQRLFDIAKIAKSPILRKATAALLNEPSNPRLIAEMRERLRLEQEGEAYADAILFGLDGKLLLSARDAPDPLAPATSMAMATALESRGAVFAELYRCAEGVIHVDVVQPMYDAEGVPQVVVVLRSDADAFLYPLIQAWPMPSGSAETLLVQRQGNQVVFLNRLRHQAGTALTLRFPLGRNNLPAEQALLGKRGMFRGTDYRGVEVLADLRPVPESPWFLVAKVDTDEILLEAHYRAKMIALFVALAVLLAAATTTIAYRRRQAGLLHELYEAERQRREMKEELRTAFYSIGDAVMTTDQAGRVRHLNPVAERLTGWTEAEASGRLLHEVFHVVNEETRAKVENPVERVLREGTIVGLANHTLLIAKEGCELPIADSGAPIRTDTGEITGVVLVFRDQTEERAAEEGIRKLNAELEQRVRDRTAALQESNRELEAFSYSVSHDLRAPLRAIDGFTRILVDDYESRLDDEGKRVCSVIRENTGKMGQLIDDLLAFSRLGRVEMQPSTIDMRGMARAVFHEITTPEQRARIDLQLEALVQAVGDPSLMRQVWVNLLGNAVKFSSKRERAAIRVSSETKDSETVFAINDNGAGFDRQYVNKLFGVFQRLHTSKQFEGTGVGLALVQRVIHRHGGRVWADGEPDRGATFYFALPSKGT